MKKIILLVIVAFSFFSCQNRGVIILIEQPSNPILDNSRIVINLDSTKIYDGHLKSTNVSSYVSSKRSNLSNGKHELKIHAHDSTYIFTINYPRDKFIIVSSYLKKNGKVKMSILKQSKKFILH